MADYEVYLLDPENNPADDLSYFSYLDYTLVVNEIGSLTLEIPGEYGGDLGEDYRLEIYRNGDLLGETQFLVTHDGGRLSQDGEFVTAIQASSALSILRWPIVNCAPGTLYSHHSGYAGNIIKALIRQNIGALATDTSRDMSEHLVVQANADDGAILAIDAGWQRLMDTVKQVVAGSAENGVDLYYDIVKNDSGLLELRTYTGQRGDDLSTTMALSPERQNLAQPVLVKDYTAAANRVIVAGTGQEIWRNVVEVPNSDQVNNSPWGYIKEHFYATEQAKTATEAVSFGEAYIRRNANKISVSGKPTSTEGVQYGVHYKWGDKITVEFLGYIAVVYLHRVHGTVRDGNETIEVEARGNVV